MTNLLTQRQVEDLAVKVGWLRSNARIISAIAMCEAPYVTDDKKVMVDFDEVGDEALANEKWEYSRGGTQVRALRSHTGTNQYRDPLRLNEPEFNLRSARKIKLSAGGFFPWTTYKNGQYKAYLLKADGTLAFPAAPGEWVVKSGDTLSGIAIRWNISHGTSWTWQDWARTNGVRGPDYIIFPAQRLLAPREDEVGV